MEKIQNEAIIVIFFFKVGIDGLIIGSFKPSELSTMKRGAIPPPQA